LDRRLVGIPAKEVYDTWGSLSIMRALVARAHADMLAIAIRRDIRL